MIAPIGVCQEKLHFSQISFRDIWQSSGELRARIAINFYFWGFQRGCMSQKNLKFVRQDKKYFFLNWENLEKFLAEIVSRSSKCIMVRSWMGFRPSKFELYFCCVDSVRFPGSKRSGNTINEKNVIFASKPYPPKIVRAKKSDFFSGTDNKRMSL